MAFGGRYGGEIISREERAIQSGLLEPVQEYLLGASALPGGQCGREIGQDANLLRGMDQ